MAPRYNWKRGASVCGLSADDLLDEKKKTPAPRYNWKRGACAVSWRFIWYKKNLGSPIQLEAGSSACVQSSGDLLDPGSHL